ncbi:alkaline shock response membrane anchor protein AmaP [Brevibacterium sp. R8603A2]|uniref:DUF6458 family protein n=1 Tax=Brevibacterium sp. R8603A2 TaxID=2929779 RepID=UPI001FF8EDA6|nr:DUF6458 family protein [Brevibacterium sp. R8603A2]MCK1803962.1 alkaline shock response membrane anchor protein AmaP [Brevibacterium sp. R8603A2]
MGFGVGVFLILVGAILAFAVQDAWSVMDLTMVGYICIGVGVLALILGFVTLASRRRRSDVTYREAPAPGPQAGPGSNVERTEHYRDGL